MEPTTTVLDRRASTTAGPATRGSLSRPRHPQGPRTRTRPSTPLAVPPPNTGLTESTTSTTTTVATAGASTGAPSSSSPRDGLFQVFEEPDDENVQGIGEEGTMEQAARDAEEGQQPGEAELGLQTGKDNPEAPATLGSGEEDEAGEDPRRQSVTASASAVSYDSPKAAFRNSALPSVIADTGVGGDEEEPPAVQEERSPSVDADVVESVEPESLAPPAPPPASDPHLADLHSADPPPALAQYRDTSTIQSEVPPESEQVQQAPSPTILQSSGETSSISRPEEPQDDPPEDPEQQTYEHGFAPHHVDTTTREGSEQDVPTIPTTPAPPYIDTSPQAAQQSLLPPSPPPAPALPLPPVPPSSSVSASASSSTPAPPIPLSFPPPPSIPPLPVPPPLDFTAPPVQWKGMPLQAAQWTLTSTELQNIVSRVIRSSAKESFIRLLSVDMLDNTFPKEMDKLEGDKAGAQAQYTFNVRRRAMLLQAMHSAARQALNTSMSPPSTSTPGSPQNATAAGVDPVLLFGLIAQLTDLTSSADRLVEVLLQTVSQQMQMQKLEDVHWASALAIALRKLNASFAKRTKEVVESRLKIKQLEAEVEEAWGEAERLAKELDLKEEEEAARADAMAAVAAGQRYEEEEEYRRREEEEIKRGNRLELATLGGRRSSGVTQISRGSVDASMSPTSPPPPVVNAAAETTAGAVEDVQGAIEEDANKEDDDDDDDDDDEEEEDDEVVIAQASIFNLKSPLTPPPTMLRMKKSNPNLIGEASLVSEVVPWSSIPSMPAFARSQASNKSSPTHTPGSSVGMGLSSSQTHISPSGSGSGPASWRNSQIVSPPPNPAPALPLPPVPPSPSYPPPLPPQALSADADAPTSATLAANGPTQEISVPPTLPFSSKSPPTSPRSAANLRVIIPPNNSPGLLAPAPASFARPPKVNTSADGAPPPPVSRPISTFSTATAGSVSTPITPGGTRRERMSHSASVSAARRRSKRASQTSLRLHKGSSSAAAPPVPQMPSQFSSTLGTSLSNPNMYAAHNTSHTEETNAPAALGVNDDGDLFSTILDPQLASTLVNPLDSLSSSKQRVMSMTPIGGTTTEGVKRRGSLAGYPYPESFKNYRTRQEAGGGLPNVQDVDDREHDAETITSETRDDIGVFTSSMPSHGIPPIWLTSEHSSTRASSPIQAHPSQAYTFSNGTTPSFSQVLDPASASSDIHYRSHSHWSPYSPYDPQTPGGQHQNQQHYQHHASSSYDSNDPENGGLKPVRPELKSTFSTPSQSPSSPRLSRPLGLGGFFLSGSNGSGGGGTGGRELTFVPPTGTSSGNTNNTRAGASSPGPSATAGSRRGAVSPEGTPNSSSKRHSTYAKLKTLTKRYSLSMNPFTHGASSSSAPSTAAAAAAGHGQAKQSQQQVFEPLVEEADEDRVSSGFSPTTGGSMRSRGAAGSRSMRSDEDVLDITA